MKILGILSLLITVVLISFLAVEQLQSIGSSSNPKSNVDKAASAKKQTDLISLTTKLNAYFFANTHYPTDLEQLNDPAVNSSQFQYQLCSENKVVVIQTSSQAKLALQDGTETKDTSC